MLRFAKLINSLIRLKHILNFLSTLTVPIGVCLKIVVYTTCSEWHSTFISVCLESGNDVNSILVYSRGVTQILSRVGKTSCTFDVEIISPCRYTVFSYSLSLYILATALQNGPSSRQYLCAMEDRKTRYDSWAVSKVHTWELTSERSLTPTQWLFLYLLLLQLKHVNKKHLI